MNGPFRKKAEKYGVWVYLNHEKHMWLHNTSEGQAEWKKLRATAQMVFEARYSHELWMKEFKHNYL